MEIDLFMAAAHAVEKERKEGGGWRGLSATNAKVILHISPRHEKCKPTPNSSPWPRHLILLSFLESVRCDEWLSIQSCLHEQLTFSQKLEDLIVKEFITDKTRFL